MPIQSNNSGGNTAQKATSFSLSKRISSARLHEFNTISKFKTGYRNREDITILPPGILVAGSKNVLTNVYNRIGNRKGYTLYGQKDTTAVELQSPILSSYDWNDHNYFENHLRAGFLSSVSTGKLQAVYTAQAGDYYNGTTFTAGQIYWLDLMTGLNSVNFNFTEFTDTAEQTKSLLMVNGAKAIYEWSGGIATIKSTSATAGNIASTAVTALHGGSGYKIGDILTITGGGGTDGTVTVLTTLNGVISTFTIGSTGTGYAPGDTLSVSNAGNDARFTVATVGGGGIITGLTMTANGSNYPTGTDLPFHTLTGVGTGASIIISAVNNNAVGTVNLTTPGSGYSAGNGNATSGGLGTGAQINILTITTNSITINGDLSIQQLGFFATASKNKTFLINGRVYAYTAIFGNVFTGVSGDPTGEPVQSVILQAVNTYNSSDFTSFATAANFTLDLIATNYQNEVYVGCLTNSTYYVSKVNNFTDYAFSSPRLPGEGATFTLAAPPKAFTPQDTQTYISAGQSNWYVDSFILSADQVNEVYVAQRLKTTGKQGTQSQALTTKIKNNIAFLSFEPIINSLGPVTNILNDPQTSDLSYSIVNDINAYDSTDGSMLYDRMFLYVAFPKEQLFRMYNMTDQETDKSGNKVNIYWEAPLTIPASRFSIINGDVYFHSYLVGETYKLFDGYSDNGHPISAVAQFSFNNNGIPTESKSFNEYYVEGYIKPNTTLNLNVQLDYRPGSTPLTKQIIGTDQQIVLTSGANNSLGKVSLGKNPIGSTALTSNPDQPENKFRVIKVFSRSPYYEEQTSFSSTGMDLQWEILRFSSNAAPTSEGNNNLKE